jgi:hypothetical protein
MRQPVAGDVENNAKEDEQQASGWRDRPEIH